MSRICFALFFKMRQPRVVAEIIGGIILGPSVFGRIPGFSETIFPSQSIPLLNLCATFGLAFFLFTAGLEIDLHLIRRHARTSLAISAAGLLVPFGFGGLLSVILYHKFADDTVDFGHVLSPEPSVLDFDTRSGSGWDVSHAPSRARGAFLCSP